MLRGLAVVKSLDRRDCQSRVAVCDDCDDDSVGMRLELSLARVA